MQRFDQPESLAGAEAEIILEPCGRIPLPPSTSAAGDDIVRAPA